MPMDFLVENDKEILRNIRQPEDFIEDSFEAIDIGLMATAIVGKLKTAENLVDHQLNPDKKSVQGIKFQKPEWDLESALAFLQDNQKSFNSVEGVKKFANLRSIPGVEIFSAGTWNGDTYTVEDLDAMVQAFKEHEDHVRPFLKLGHDDKQAVLKNEGLPAAGWVGRIYRVGEKLMADFVDIPDKIFKLIQNKAYRKVSSEIFVNPKIGEKSHKYMLGAVALLGAETPGVMNLNDILARFGVGKGAELKSYSTDIDKLVFETNLTEGPMPKSEREIQLETELKQKEEALKALENEKKDFSKKQEEHSDVLKKALEEKEALEKKFSAVQKEKAEQELEAQADKLVAEKVISKGQRELALKLLGPEKKNYSKEEGKSVSKFDLLKEFAELSKKNAEVNLDEDSEVGKKGAEQSVEEIEKYAKEHDIDFGEAYARMFKGKLSVEKADLEKED